MAGDFVNIELNDAELQAAFKRLIATVSNLKPVFDDIGEYMVKATKERFVNSKAPDGTTWAENTPATLARKPGDKPLIGESKALSSIIKTESSAQGVVIGSPLKYAAVQQFGAKQGAFGTSKRGGPLPWGDIPARPFLGISDADQVEIRDIIEEHIRSALR